MARVVDGPDLDHEPDRRCPDAPAHLWRPAPESDAEWGSGFRCCHCRLVRWRWQVPNRPLHDLPASWVDGRYVDRPTLFDPDSLTPSLF